MRVIATLLVVLGHCGYYKIVTDYGGCDFSQYISEGNLIRKALSRLVGLIYLFHMPLFMGLSGALFHIGFQNGRYKTLKQVVINKFKRLMIPFFVVTFLHSIPLKYLAGYYDSSDNLLRDIVIGQVFIQGNTHLWFCMVLFVVVVIAYILEKNVKIPSGYKLILLTAVHMAGSMIRITVISETCKYLLWFYMGYAFESKRKYVNKGINCNKIVCHIVLFGIMYIVYRLLPGNMGQVVKVLRKMWGILVICAACLIVYEIAYVICGKAMEKSKIYHIILSDSFGIYLYSDTWNYVILAVAVTVLRNGILDTGIGYLTLFIARFCITLWLSILLTEIIKRMNIKCLH